jgi:hypothetical protein
VRALLALVLVAAVAGCGGGSSHDDFVRDAAAICKRANERVTALGVPESYTDTLLYARRAEDAVRDQIEALRELDPPEGDRKHFEDYLDTLARRRVQLDHLSVAADANNISDIQGIGTQLNALTRQGRAQARRAGLTNCE